MKKEYVVTEITAAPDGAPYVLVTLKDPKDMDTRRTPLGPQTGVFTSFDDLARNLGRMFSTQMMGSFATIIKLGLSEYEELNIKVGDRILLDISKAEWGSV